jgi:hypothetical protein
MPTNDSSRNYFRIACEFQVRIRVIDDEELVVFKNYAMRPSPYSSLKYELENQLQSMQIREESKFLFEKAFQLLINIDQRLERIEEQLVQREARAATETYEWVHGDLSAGGIAYQTQSKQPMKLDDKVLVDVILPSLPEYRFVAAGKIVHLDASLNLGVEFLAIHDDDREQIHRHVIQRERELLRARAGAKDKASDLKK